MKTDTATGVSRALRLLGSAYRNDWSEFDGRVLKAELEELAGALDKEGFDLEEWAADRICMAHGCWEYGCRACGLD